MYYTRRDPSTHCNGRIFFDSIPRVKMLIRFLLLATWKKMPMIFSLLAMFSRPAFVPIYLVPCLIINPSFVVRRSVGWVSEREKRVRYPFSIRCAC